ncbi:MAG: hypothetical protein KatS3mg042_0853 [Rhodothermaceae bacterium]|nr:MAG: hypothetical protein KatS3mg042_0853 [Rhodothermaceae bacterium]
MRGSVFGGMVLAAWLGVAAGVRAQPEASFEVAAVKYEGGGDWYQAQTPLPTFLAFVRTQTMVDVASRPAVVELSSDKLFNYPFLVLSGHGNVVFSDDEARRLRRYLEGGGFLYIDDDYGLDRYIRREMKKVFPELEFVELPFSHPIYRAHFTFSNGLPKIHEHDGKPPQGFGLIHNGRLVAFYTYETNLTDGWEPPEVHHDPPEKREAALQMGTNILVYALTH